MASLTNILSKLESVILQAKGLFNNYVIALGGGAIDGRGIENDYGRLQGEGGGEAVANT